MRMEWLLCPICKSKTRLQLREDTELKNFPSGAVRNPQPHLRIHDAGGHRNVYGGAGAGAGKGKGFHRK